VVLLNSVAAASGVQKGTVDQITAALQSVVALGAAPDASPQARAQADQVARLLDAGSSTAAVAPGTGASAIVLPPAVTARLAAGPPGRDPAGVYVQIGSDDRRLLAQQALAALQQATAERVPTRGARAPPAALLSGQGVRGHAAAGAAGAVAAAEPAGHDPLKPAQCGNVRPNHLELWLAD
jgi:hypothetical protein